MFESLFNQKMQFAMFDVIIKLMEQYQTQLDGGTASATTTSGAVSPSSFADLIQEKAAQYGIDAALVDAVVKAESAYNPNAVSSAGAQGLMQLMPATAQGLGVANPMDPEQNVDGGVRLLSQLLERYNGNTELALAAYNAGPGAVDRYGGIPPYTETQTYVQRIMGYLQPANEWSS